MPIDSVHPRYKKASIAWERARDCYEGEDAVKAKRTQYLPVLEGQKSGSPEYEAYLLRAAFFPAVERTTLGLVGTATRKPPVILAPSSIVDMLDDLTLAHEAFQSVLIQVLCDLLLVGRIGILIDYDEVSQRPFWQTYAAEDIVNWREARVGGEIALVWLVLREVVERVSAKGQQETVTRFREYTREEGGGVVCRLFERSPSGSGAQEWMLVQEAHPTRAGKALTSIPFVCLNPTNIGMTLQKPPLNDLCLINLSHYRSSADLEHGRHFTALPTPWVTGWAGDASGEPLRIGAGTAWIIPNEQAKVGMLEFTGQGLKSLETALEEKERKMAVVGARLLEQQPRQAETAEAVRLRQTGEHAALGTVVGTCSAGLALALQWLAWWSGLDAIGDKAVEVRLNRDFFESRLTAQEAQALTALWQEGAICYETLYWNLQQGEWARPGVEWEEEKEAADAELPDEPEPLEPLPGDPMADGLPPSEDDDAA